MCQVFAGKEVIARRSSTMETGDHFKNVASPKSLMSRRNIMKRTFLFFAFFWVNVASLFAQDVITLKNGEDIQGLVLEIGIDDVKYKKFENPNGPSYTLKKSDVLMIRYFNGSKDVFADHAKPTPVEADTQTKEELPVSYQPTSATTRTSGNPYKFRMYIGTGSGHSYGVFGTSLEARFYSFGIHAGTGWHPNFDSPTWSVGTKWYFWKNLYIDAMVGVIGQYYEYEYGSYFSYEKYYPMVGGTEMFGVNWSWGRNVRFGVNLGVGFAYGFNYDWFGVAYDVGISISFGTR